MQQLQKQGDLNAYTAGYDRFRRRTIEAAANPLLTEMLDSIFEKTPVLIRRILIPPGRVDTGQREHIAVLEAMRRGDADGAEALRRANMRSALVRHPAGSYNAPMSEPLEMEIFSDYV